MGRLYSQPYLEGSPDFAFVLEDEAGVMGYTLGALDSVPFLSWMGSEYLPKVRAKIPRPADAAEGSTLTPTQRIHREYYEWDGSLPTVLTQLYPSHLHIDIVARGQGKGHGGRLIKTLLDALRSAGSRGVHLGMAPRNQRAYGFYKKMGFHELFRSDSDLILGLRFPENCPVVAPPPLMSGVLEGFYGRPWSQAQRTELVSHLAKWGLNTYMYGPKDDRKHRAAWRELYSVEDGEAAALQELVSACASAGVTFVYAIAPGLDMQHWDPKERALLQAKIQQLVAMGVTAFAMLFDDIPDALSEQDAAVFSTQADAQAAVANEAFMGILEAVWATKPGSPLPYLLLCPTEYCGALAQPSVAESKYLSKLGEQLIPEAAVLWTGGDIISKTITVAEVTAVSAVLNHRIAIWDNLHANDYDNGRRLYLGPYCGREQGLVHCVQGLLSNPNCEYEGNFVPLRTLSLFTAASARGETYDPRAAFMQATAEWHPRFSGSGLTPEDISLLGDFYYLPFENGPAADALLACGREVLSAPRTTADPSRLLELQARCDAAARLYRCVTELHHRELSYTLLRYTWDVKEESIVLKEFAGWLHSPLSEGKLEEGVKSKYHIVGPIRGGFTHQIQRLLVFGEDGLFHLPTKP